MSERRIRVGVLFGGRSCEHEVSLQSARAVMNAMDRARFEVIPIGVTKEGQWVTFADPRLAPDKATVLPGDGRSVTMVPEPTRQGLSALVSERSDGPVQSVAGVPIDVVFPLIHGTFGEDGTVQGLLELTGIPYVGSGVLGSAVGMDKAVMKALFEQRGLRVAPYRVVTRKRIRESLDAVRAECENALPPYPWFVKPANLGSSVGISKVHDEAELGPALDMAIRFDSKLVIEAAVTDAREIEVAVLGNDEPEVSVPGEIFPSNEFYDYNAKYVDNASDFAIPADLPPDVADRIRNCAREAFVALDCAGLARVDFLVRRSDYEIFILEANTIPGFTPISMYPKLWEASGIAYGDLIERLIDLALKRHQDRRQNQTSYA